MRRSEGIDPFDAFYRVYIAALVVGILLIYVANALGDAAVSANATAEVQREGAATLGLLTALAFAVGVRSGSRGGPLALEDAEVHHVLLAPVDRARALAGPALRQLQFLTFAATTTGAVIGLFAASRLPGSVAAWTVSGAAWAALNMVGATAAAWVSATIPLPQWVATALAAVLVGSAGLDVARATETLPDLPRQLEYLPSELFGRVGTWPLADHALVWIPVLVVVTLAAVASRRLERVSIERLKARARLVGQMRFAATMRDLRTVMVLRRQLSQERPRATPWVPLRSPATGRGRGLMRGETWAIVRRDVRSLLRTPATRVIRLAGFVGGAAVAGIGAYRGTTALVALAGLCGFLAALEATEPLAEELDRSPILLLAPTVRGGVLIRHLLVPAVVLIAAGGLAVGALALGGLAGDPLAVAATVVVPAALASLAGASISIVRNDTTSGGLGDTANMVPPEVAGLGLVYQTLFPPAVAVVGFVPILAARAATSDTAVDAIAPADAARGLAVFVAIGVALVVAWIRYRDDIGASMRAANEEARYGARLQATVPEHDEGPDA